MNHESAHLTVAVTLVTLLAGCGGAHAQAQPPVTLPREVVDSGESIYLGKVYPLDQAPAPARAPLFVYERRVAERDGATLSTHITRDGSGRVVFADSATHAPDYRLIDYTLHGTQLGQSGTIHVEGDQVSFHRICKNGEKRRVETQRDPVMVGPTLVGYLFRHLGELRDGRKLPVRLAVLDRMETIGFDLEAVAAQPGQTQIRMKPSSFIIAAVVDPFYFTFETSTGKLVRLEGRVPPKVPDGDRLSDLDARVEYQFLTASYR